jgi:hypothetical protein
MGSPTTPFWSRPQTSRNVMVSASNWFSRAVISSRTGSSTRAAAASLRFRRTGSLARWCKTGLGIDGLSSFGSKVLAFHFCSFSAISAFAPGMYQPFRRRRYVRLVLQSKMDSSEGDTRTSYILAPQKVPSGSASAVTIRGREHTHPGSGINVATRQAECANAITACRGLGRRYSRRGSNGS